MPTEPSNPVREKIHRKNLTIKERVEVLRLLDENWTHQRVANKFGIARRSVGNINVDREMILLEMSQLEEYGRNGNNKRRTMTIDYRTKSIDIAMNSWFEILLELGSSITLSSDVLTFKALELAKHLGYTNFQDSNGWLESYTKRYNIIVRKVSGPSEHSHINDALQVEVDNLREELDHIEPECVWNVDESALYYRALSATSFTFRHTPESNFTFPKDRFTLTLCVSASGEKLPLQVIGTDMRPLEHANSNCSMNYDCSNNGWQSHATFVRYMVELDKLAKSRNKNFIVLLDRAICHVNAVKFMCRTDGNSNHNGDQVRKGLHVFGNLVFMFLPSSTSSHLQPIDMGIMRSFKCTYRKIILENGVEAFHEHGKRSTSPFNMNETLTTQNCLVWMNAAWDQVRPEVIQSCWTKTPVLPESTIADLNQDVQHFTDEAMINLSDTMASIDSQVIESLVDGFTDERSIGEICEALVAVDDDEMVDDLKISTTTILERARIFQPPQETINDESHYHNERHYHDENPRASQSRNSAPTEVYIQPQQNPSASQSRNSAPTEVYIQPQQNPSASQSRNSYPTEVLVQPQQNPNTSQSRNSYPTEVFVQPQQNPNTSQSRNSYPTEVFVQPRQNPLNDPYFFDFALQSYRNLHHCFIQCGEIENASKLRELFRVVEAHSDRSYAYR